MTVEEIIALCHAGYNSDQIMQLAQAQQMERAQQMQLAQAQQMERAQQMQQPQTTGEETQQSSQGQSGGNDYDPFPDLYDYYFGQNGR